MMMIIGFTYSKKMGVDSFLRNYVVEDRYV